MISINYRGRLGNNIIQYFAARILSEKNKLYLNTEPKNIYDWGSFFDIRPTESSYNKGKHIIEVNDNNFIDFLNSEKQLEINHYILNGYFQTKYLLHSYQDYIRSNLRINYEHTDPSQVFVIYRIGDLDGLRQMLPKEYYEEALDGLNFSNGYITSDTIDHPFVQELSIKYKLKLIIFDNPLDQINFTKNFNQLVLSEGTFSWWTGFLSRAQTIITNKRSFTWFGNDIFDFPEWKKLYWDYDTQYINKYNQIIKYKPIKNK